jgi:hypothetical protein
VRTEFEGQSLITRRQYHYYVDSTELRLNHASAK